jgi:hypothetical protein
MGSLKPQEVFTPSAEVLVWSGYGFREKSVAHLVESAPRRQTCRNVPRAEELHRCDRTALWRKTEKMPTSEMDRLVAEATTRNAATSTWSRSALQIRPFVINC